MYVSVGKKRYWVKVQGDGYPLLLLHGFTGSMKTWDMFIEKWKEKYRVITIDLPGHGKTKVNEIVYMDEFCHDLENILVQLKVKKLHVLGYSLGGRTALSFALLFPSFVDQLILESASPGLEKREEQITRQQKDESLAEMIEAKGVPFFVDYWENIPLFETQKRLPVSLKKSIREERLSHTREGLALSLRGMGTGVQSSRWESLKFISAKVLLIVGALDNKFVQIAKHMQEQIPYCEVEKVLGAGHAIHVEQSDLFDTIVTGFLKEPSL